MTNRKNHKTKIKLKRCLYILKTEHKETQQVQLLFFIEIKVGAEVPFIWHWSNLQLPIGARKVLNQLRGMCSIMISNSTVKKL